EFRTKTWSACSQWPKGKGCQAFQSRVAVILLKRTLLIEHTTILSPVTLLARKSIITRSSWMPTSGNGTVRLSSLTFPRSPWDGTNAPGKDKQVRTKRQDTILQTGHRRDLPDFLTMRTLG